MTSYQMTTLSNGTRIRSDHTTFAPQITTVAANVTVRGDEKWVAPANFEEVKAGDIWIRVTYGMFTGWMAYIHKGVPICKDLQEIAPPTPTEYRLITPTRIIIEGNDPVTGARIQDVIFDSNIP